MAGKMIIGPDADNCGVQKKVLYPGVGELPDYSPNTKIHFHFRTLRRNDDRTVLDDTKNSKKPFELIVGKKFKLDCWELCLKTMRLNEVAQFSVHKSLVVSYPIVAKQLRDIIAGRQPQEHRTHCCGMMALQQMGLGHADLEQMLKEPEDLDFIFEVCKIDYAGDYRKDAWAMDEEEKLSQVPVLRDEGNRLYKAGDIAGAAQKYGEALTNLEQLCLREKPGDEEYLLLDRQKIPLLLNFSQCRLLQKDYYPVIEHTTTVLQKDPDNVKALYRRARAHVAAWNPREARDDFSRVATLDPAMSRTVERELTALDSLEKQKTADDRARLQGKLFT